MLLYIQVKNVNVTILNFMIFIESALLDKRDLYILVTDTCNCTSW